MLKVINTKILIAIFAALTLIGGLLYRQNRIAEQQAADAAKARQILEEQQKATEEQKRENERFAKQVNEGKKHAPYDTGGSNNNKKGGFIP